MYLQFFSDFHETLPFNYDSPVPEGGMREKGRNGGVIRWSWGRLAKLPGVSYDSRRNREGEGGTRGIPEQTLICIQKAIAGAGAAGPRSKNSNFLHRLLFQESLVK